jgi:magnesium chelatase family protein
VARYRGKISGPLLDRIDMLIDVPALKEEELMQATVAESTADIRARVARARQIQLNRQGMPNAGLGSLDIEQYCHTDETGLTLLKSVVSRMSLSARAYHRILKVARTIADLGQASSIESTHIAEAIQYRRGE